MALYKRIILKLSGEALADKKNQNILDANMLSEIAKVIKKIYEQGVQIGVVIGAGNIFRGKISSNIGIDNVNGDYMGMLGTVINCIALSNAVSKLGIPTSVLSALEINKVVEPYSNRKALKYLDKNKVVFFAGGTGNPFFTTDTCAALRALEINADAILMSKNGVNGVYDDDPRINKEAKLIKKLNFQEILNKNLTVMDQSAVSMLKGKGILVRVFSMNDIDNFEKVLIDESVGTTIKE